MLSLIFLVFGTTISVYSLSLQYSNSRISLKNAERLHTEQVWNNVDIVGMFMSVCL